MAADAGGSRRNTGALAMAQSATYQPPRQQNGKPDLQGVWSTASVTRLVRPPGLPLVLSRAQADELEGGNLFNQRSKTEANFVYRTGAPEKGKPLPPVGNYDVAYTDPGSTVASINASCARPSSCSPSTARFRR